MKRYLSAVLAIFVAFSCVYAQETMTREQFLQRYSLLVSRLGVSGVGVENLLSKWEEAYPDDLDMLSAKFMYYYNKSRSTEVIVVEGNRYLGAEPVLSLKDSLGRDMNYFEEPHFDDELFSLGEQSIDKAIRLYPERLDLRFNKSAALLDYEKGSPDMTLSYLKNLVGYNYTAHPAWIFNDGPVDNETFCALMQEYCYSLFLLGTPNGYEAFRELSETMLKYNADDPLFMNDIGSYYFVGKKDGKTALKWYNKVLKKHPDDMTAIRNCILVARRDKNAKLEKKYLQMMASHGSETERLQAEARLKSLK